jgi:hypothetical protein
MSRWGVGPGTANWCMHLLRSRRSWRFSRRSSRRIHGWRTLSALLLISFAVVESGIALQVIGDYQVADSIWRTSGNPGFGDGYTEGHDRSELGDLLVSVGGLAFAITAGIAQRVPGTLAVVAGVMVIIPPPWVWPAAGVLVLILYGLTSESRLLPRTRPGRTEPADASRSVNPGV